MPIKPLHLECKDCPVRCYSIFSHLADEDVDRLNLEKESTHYKKGQIIFYEGTQPRGLYVVVSGKIKISKLGSNAREQIVRLAKPGDILGYRSLLSGGSYFASAATLEDSSVCFIPKSLVFDLLNKDASLSMKMMRQLTVDLAQAEHRMVEMVQKPVRDRLAEALLLLKEVYGLEEDDQTLKVTLTREDLANLIGTTTETTIRILSEMKDEGIIRLERKRILLTDIPRLVKASQLND